MEFVSICKFLYRNIIFFEGSNLVKLFFIVYWGYDSKICKGLGVG